LHFGTLALQGTSRGQCSFLAMSKDWEGNEMAPEERVERCQQAVERLRADIEWLHASGFFVQDASNDELIMGFDQAARLNAAIVEDLTRPPG
jgi:hypothetical protein